MATRLISMEDDPPHRVFTSRMWFLGLGLSCFGAVLGQIFYFRPQTMFVWQLFLQVIAYIPVVSWKKSSPAPPVVWVDKKHVANTIFASTAADSALAISIFAADTSYYNISPNVGVSIFTVIGSSSDTILVRLPCVSYLYYFRHSTAFSSSYRALYFSNYQVYIFDFPGMS
ncbi:hypothetical protein EUX98_g9742 [Antrodiella citrinella]|uniref:Uncharacterized protein n=1 Tax=Antrodiella citrinella TaxID=2447956 RepID=A0A4S4LP34_9APHY|nr:hypothetical protein EUX98_g9742 [Antrodiella citrinella]